MLGEEVWLVLLNDPLSPPFAGLKFVIDHAADIADPPKLAPLNMNAEGVVGSQILSGPPAVIVFAVTDGCEPLKVRGEV